MPVSREFKDRMRVRYSHVYDPKALGRLYENRKHANGALRVSLPTGATLPKEPALVPVYEHSAYKPPRKLTAVEVARLLRERHGPWPLA